MTDHCTTSSKDSKIKVEENQRKAIFKNDSKLTYKISQVDGCLILEGARCDFLVTKENEASVLVELKGSDIKHACEQLMTSAEHIAVKHLLAQKLGFLVICSRYPRFDTAVAKAKQLIAKKHKAGFHVVCRQGAFDIMRVVAIDGPY